MWTTAAKAELEKLRPATSVPTEPVRWCPHGPTERQAAFLDAALRAVDPELPTETLYGGAAGGGKTDALLMAALRYVDHPRYRAVLFRRSYPELAGAGGLIERSQQWLSGTSALWSATEKRWTFPSGARLFFKHLGREDEKHLYQGHEFHFVGFDELTQFGEQEYRYLLGRIRRLSGDRDLPLRAMSASNPGGRGHEWVKQRFIVEQGVAGRAFVPAKLTDNPHLDQKAYVHGLMQLHPLERAQLLEGDWEAQPSGGFFQRTWFVDAQNGRHIADKAPHGTSFVRFWDLAATEDTPGKDPDYTAGALVGFHDGKWYIADMQRKRLGPDGVEKLVRVTAEIDGPGVPIRMEQEPGASGKTLIDHYARRVLIGFDFKGVSASGDKRTRAAPVASAAEQGNVVLVRGQWVTDFLDEAGAFPHGSHDDMVDALSGAVANYAHRGPVEVVSWERAGKRAVRGFRDHY